VGHGYRAWDSLLSSSGWIEIVNNAALYQDTTLRYPQRCGSIQRDTTSEALAQALASDAPVKRKLYYLSDLAGVYALQGEVETACSYVTQTVPLLMQVGNGSKTIRQHLLQARMLLRPFERTSYVQALDERMAPLLDSKQK
jgi:hypothetical protein